MWKTGTKVLTIGVNISRFPTVYGPQPTVWASCGMLMDRDYKWLCSLSSRWFWHEKRLWRCVALLQISMQGRKNLVCMPDICLIATQSGSGGDSYCSRHRWWRSLSELKTKTALSERGYNSAEYWNLDFASHKFAVDARCEGCRCISILQAFRNEADAAKSCDLFFANKSIFWTICI